MFLRTRSLFEEQPLPFAPGFFTPWFDPGSPQETRSEARMETLNEDPAPDAATEELKQRMRDIAARLSDLEQAVQQSSG